MVFVNSLDSLPPEEKEIYLGSDFGHYSTEQVYDFLDSLNLMIGLDSKHKGGASFVYTDVLQVFFDINSVLRDNFENFANVYKSFELPSCSFQAVMRPDFLTHLRNNIPNFNELYNSRVSLDLLIKSPHFGLTDVAEGNLMLVLDGFEGIDELTVHYTM